MGAQMIAPWNKDDKIEHRLTLQSNLWEGILLSCTCDWAYRHSSPWPARELVDVCNAHIRSQEVVEKKKES